MSFSISLSLSGTRDAEACRCGGGGPETWERSPIRPMVDALGWTTVSKFQLSEISFASCVKSPGAA
jgi:hypothetical protein